MRDPHIDKLINDFKAKKFREGEAKGLMDTVGSELTKQLGPLFSDHSKEMTSKVGDAVQKALASVKFPEFPQNPEIPAPIVNVPAPVVNIPAPVVNIPAPVVNIPKQEFPAYPDFPADFALRGVNNKNPLPVRWMNSKGEDVQFPISLGGGSGRGDFFTIKDIQNSTGGSIIDNDGFVKVTGSFSVTTSNNSTQAIDSSGNPYSVANPFPVVFSSSGSTASALIDSSGVQYSGSNPLPVVFGASATQGVNIVDSSGVAYSGSNGVPVTGTVLVSDVSASLKVALTDSSGVQYSGSNPLPITGPVVVTSITNSVAAALVDSNGVAYSGSNPLPIVGPVVVTSVTNTVAASNVDSSGVQYSGSNPFPYTLVTNATATMNVALTDSGGVQYSGSNPLPITGPVVVTSITNTVAAANVDSSGVQYSGTNPFPFTLVTNATATMNVALTDSGGVQYSGSNPLPITGPVVVTSITNTIAAYNVDSSGVGYNGSNPLPVTLISGALTSTLSVGDSAARSADNGGNPVKVGGIARTTNPAAYADGDRANIGLDKLGRQLVRPIQVRDLIKTAYVSLTTGTEATLLTAAAGTFADLIMITATNNSTAATQLDIRATSAGNIIHTMYLPASTGPVGFTPSVPWPQDSTGNSWTIDMPDQTGTTVYVSALFSQEL